MWRVDAKRIAHADSFFDFHRKRVRLDNDSVEQRFAWL
jgi:hypothetical protein